jgi:hypothetical protein
MPSTHFNFIDFVSVRQALQALPSYLGLALLSIFVCTTNSQVDPAVGWVQPVLSGLSLPHDPTLLHHDMHAYLAGCGVDGVKVGRSGGLGGKTSHVPGGESKRVCVGVGVVGWGGRLRGGLELMGAADPCTLHP